MVHTEGMSVALVLMSPPLSMWEAAPVRRTDGELFTAGGYASNELHSRPEDGCVNELKRLNQNGAITDEVNGVNNVRMKLQLPITTRVKRLRFLYSGRS